MSRYSLVSFTVLMMLSMPSSGRDFGVRGPLVAIGEINMLAWIEQRLNTLDASGEMAQMQRDFIARVEASVQQPTAAVSLQTTSRPVSYRVDPTLVTAVDLHDGEGNVIHPAGTRVNPFDVSAYSKQIVVLDGEDRQQVAWARQYQPAKPVKWILINGSPIALSDVLDAKVYFDQRGDISRQFGLAHVPVVIEQEGRFWRINEIDPIAARSQP